MDPLTDLGVAVAAEVATSSLAKIKNTLRTYITTRALQEARAHLDAKTTDAIKFSDDAKTRLREVASSVQDWHSDADKLHQESEKVISRNNISCLNLWSRYSSSKFSWELTQDNDEKLGCAPDFGTSFDRHISEGDKFNLKGYMEFESRRKILDGVLKALKDDDVSMCSICGMRGIGKTTMAKKLVKLVEADRLFTKVAMVTVSQNPNFKKIQNEIIELLGLKMARKIEAECNGLPIAIATIARALKDKPRGEWNDSLKKLKMSILQRVSDMEKVYSRIQLSYDLLKDSEAQSCLRLCCLFPEDYDVPVEKLVFYGWGLDLFEGVDSLKEARDIDDSMVHKLKNSFLLLDGDKEECVKLHDIVRDFAIWISSNDEYPYLVRCEKEMNKWPEQCQNEKYCAVSIVSNTIKGHIPLELRCPNLKLLQIHFDDSLKELPNRFFKGMEELKVVDLHVQSPIPPLSIQKSLKTLLISNEDLGWWEAPPDYFVEKLVEVDMKNVKIFSVSSILLSEFPMEIGLMCNLRSLRFHKVHFDYMPPGVLSNLVNLEELELSTDFNGWGLQESQGIRINASLDEIASLPLTSITIGLQLNSILAENIIKTVARFRISIGLFGCDYQYDLGSNVLHVNNVDECDIVVNRTSLLLRKCHKLILESADFKYVMSQQFKANNWYDCSNFSQLKTLTLEDMHDGEEIFHGPYLPNIQRPCFFGLTEIIMNHCPKLKRVFPLSVAPELAQLQSMHLWDCCEVEEIFYKNLGG